jgi:hypothetical protein
MTIQTVETLLALHDKAARHDCEPLRTKYRNELSAALTEALQKRDESIDYLTRQCEKYAAQAAQPVREPIQFLCDATRFKVRQHEGDEAGRIYGLPSELNGKWVALVAADDDCHLNLSQPVRDANAPS